MPDSNALSPGEIPAAEPERTVDSLILDLLEWIGPGARPYAEVLEAWRTSCPRLPVWEEANDRGFVERRREAAGVFVVVTKLGNDYLRANHRTTQEQR